MVELEAEIDMSSSADGPAVSESELLDKRDRFLARHEERHAAKDHSVKSRQNVNLERVVKFESEFRSLLKTIEKTMSDPELCQQELSELRRMVQESALVLPGYEARKAQLELKSLEERIKAHRSETSGVGKKKGFSFSRTKAPKPEGTHSSEIVTNPEINSDQDSDKIRKMAGDQQMIGTFVLEDLDSETVAVGREADGKDVVVRNAKDCVFKLKCVAGSMRLRNLDRCTVLAWPVSSSIMVEHCTNCTFVIGCQQLRTHSTTASTLYLHVVSNPIIEDCSGLSFAPYLLKPSDLAEASAVSKVDFSKNRWSCVQDFNWLTSDQPSPNWSKLPEVERAEQSF